MTNDLPLIPDGLGPEQARKLLRCSSATFARWSRDGRLPPDGWRIYKHPDGPRQWREVRGRAWHPETIEAAKQNVSRWWREDAEADKARREAWQRRQAKEKK
jgi:hypothetical protein